MPVWNAIYVGVRAIIDPTEGNTIAENASALVGLTFGSVAQPLAGNIVSVSTNDRNNNASLDQNNNVSSDRFTTNIGTGQQTYTFDAATAYSATITYLNGTTATATLVIFQDTVGRTFIAPGLTDAANAPLLAGPIRTIRLNSVVTNNALGLDPARPNLNFMPCFTAGTMILTPEGLRPVEDLRPGDRVMTRDRGAQPLYWTGRRSVEGRGAFTPVRFAPGAIGNDRALCVSPQHRMLVEGWRAELLFGAEEVLVAATHLVNDDSIRRVETERVEYIHILFDRHEIVFAEGCATESFHPGNYMLTGDAALRAELLALFPELVAPGREWDTARPVLRAHEAGVLRAA